MYTLNNKDVTNYAVGAIRCDGTVGISLFLKDESIVDINGLSLEQAKQLEKVLKSKKQQSVSIDDRFLISSDELHAKHFDIWAKRNGIIS